MWQSDKPNGRNNPEWKFLLQIFFYFLYIRQVPSMFTCAHKFAVISKNIFQHEHTARRNTSAPAKNINKRHKLTYIYLHTFWYPHTAHIYITCGRDTYIQAPKRTWLELPLACFCAIGFVRLSHWTRFCHYVRAMRHEWVYIHVQIHTHTLAYVHVHIYTHTYIVYMYILLTWTCWLGWNDIYIYIYIYTFTDIYG